MAEEASAPVAGEAGKMTMVVGVDESERSYYALQWALQHFFPPDQPQQYLLAAVTAKPTAASAIGLAGPGAAEMLPIVEADLKKSALRVIDKAKELCAQVSDAVFEVVEGDARNVLCEAVERHHAEMLVVGSHGYGAIKRFFLAICFLSSDRDPVAVCTGCSRTDAVAAASVEAKTDGADSRERTL